MDGQDIPNFWQSARLPVNKTLAKKGASLVPQGLAESETKD